MLESHAGLSSLTGDEVEAVKKGMIKGMARLKIAKPGAQRQNMVAKVIAALDADDRYWPEIISSRLTEDKVASGEAQALALMVAFDLRETEIAALFFELSANPADSFFRRVASGLFSASPEYQKRVEDQAVAEEEYMFRVFAVYFFRRDPENVFQMMSIDQLTRASKKLLPGGPLGFVLQCQKHKDLAPVPESAAGYLVTINDLRSRQGFFLLEPTEEFYRLTENMRASLRSVMGEMPSDEEWTHLLNTVHAHFDQSRDVLAIVAVFSVYAKETNTPYMIARLENSDRGLLSHITPFKAPSVAEARKVAESTSEMRMFNDIRGLQEMLNSATEV